MRIGLFAPTVEVSAHCDLPCGVYDPAQARIEAESVKAIIDKFADNDDPDFRTRADPDQGAALRAGQAPPLGAVDRLLQAAALREVPAAAHAVQRGHQARRRGGGTKGSTDVAVADQLLAKIDEIAEIFWETKKA